MTTRRSVVHAHFGTADFPLKDLGNSFGNNLAGAMPAGIPFNPHA